MMQREVSQSTSGVFLTNVRGGSAAGFEREDQGDNDSDV
jgi:hypothetical protein